MRKGDWAIIKSGKHAGKKVLIGDKYVVAMIGLAHEVWLSPIDVVMVKPENLEPVPC